MRKHILWLTVALVAALLMPMATPTAEAEPQRSAVVAPTAGGPDVSDVRVGTPAIFETFRRDSGTWLLGPTANGNRSIADGMLIVDVPEKNKFVWSPYDGQPDEFDDFYLEVDTIHLSGPLENNYGITFRNRDASNFYLFQIDSLGSYSLSKNVDSEWETLVDWTESTAINQGRGCENNLGVLAVGDWIVLQANDVELARIRDDSFSSGWFALAAGAYDKTGTEVGFDNLRLWSAATNQGSSTGGSRSGNASVTSNTLNVRSGPSTAYAVVSTLRRGDRVQMIGRSADSQWIKINLAGKPQAWIAARYLSPDVGVQSLAVASAPAPPAATPRPSCSNEAYLLIENHIGKYITLQVSDNNFRVEGKVGDVPGRLLITLTGTGRYTVAAQLPNVGSRNFDLYVEATADRCANRTGCMALCQTVTLPFWLEN